MTPKQRVLRRWPKAYAHEWRDGWVIYSGNTVNVNLCFAGTWPTARQAWESAANRPSVQDGVRKEK